MPVGGCVYRHLPLRVEQSDVLIRRGQYGNVGVDVRIVHGEVGDRVSIGCLEARDSLIEPPLLQALDVVALFCVFVR